MIMPYSSDDFRLVCDWCEDELDEIFNTFQEAVAYKKEYGWRSVKDKYGEWYDLCPVCNKPEIITKLKGGDHDKSVRNFTEDAALVAKLIETVQKKSAKKEALRVKRQELKKEKKARRKPK